MSLAIVRADKVVRANFAPLRDAPVVRGRGAETARALIADAFALAAKLRPQAMHAMSIAFGEAVGLARVAERPDHTDEAQRPT